MKMKTYYLMISKTFPAYHPRKGQATDFKHKIYNAMMDCGVSLSGGLTPLGAGKIHTIRDNYDYWARIAHEVNAGRGILSLRQWTGSPYNFKRDGSKQEEFLQFSKIGVQNIRVIGPRVALLGRSSLTPLDPTGVAKNDGLSDADFSAWFKKPLINGAIIHFTDFRY